MPAKKSARKPAKKSKPEKVAVANKKIIMKKELKLDKKFLKI